MKVAMIGAGKLGFPVGVAMASRGHEVTFHDIDTDLLARRQSGELPPDEAGLPELYEESKARLSFAFRLQEALKDAELIFVAVQTPHSPEMDGSSRFKHVREDFDLFFIKHALYDIATALQEPSKVKGVVVISTMLPNSMDREIAPLWNGCTVPLFYSPLFIAMGAVVQDYLNPEFWLLGCRSTKWEDTYPGKPVAEFYQGIGKAAEVHVMSWASAELCKVTYNTYITAKITIANLIMALAHETPNANCDDVAGALMKATDRIVSHRYMQGGMVDGGGCHPRDLIALAWYSDRVKMMYNWFDMLASVRECQTEYLAELVEREMKATDLNAVRLLGTEFKAGTRIEAGSPALLLGAILEERGIPVGYHSQCWDTCKDEHPTVYVATVHDNRYLRHSFAPGSVLLDVWGMSCYPIAGVRIVRVGRQS